MAYEINKTDGSLLTSVPDGEIDSSSTSIRLLGKNYPGYGEIMAENLVGMLENFSADTAPPSPLHGQIWYDKANARLSFFDKDNSWKNIFSEGQSDFSTVIVSDTAPTGERKTGDVWYDKGDQGRAFIWIGSTWVDLSPAGNATGGSGGSAYTLPPATASSLGGIKVGSGLSVDSSGLLSATGGGSGGTTYTLPTASTSVLGGVKVDGSTITIANGVISAAGGGSGGTTYTLPTASTSVLGGVKVDGSTITIANGVISAVGGTATNGVGISSITRTSGDGSAGSIDTYTITFTNNTTSTFTVRNGTNGTNGTDATVTTANVASAIASIAPTSIGSYTVAEVYFGAVPGVTGTTLSGSNLAYYVYNRDTTDIVSASFPGTWKNMGVASGSTVYAAQTLLWLRIA